MDVVQHKNPFEATKATDFSDNQIRDYWVDISQGGGLVALIKPTSRLPIHVIGGKGSGKTHLMRYVSFPIQKLRFQDELLAGVAKDGFLGIYLHTDGLNTGRFHGKGQSDEVWNALFPFFMELWLSELVLSSAIELIEQTSRKDGASKRFLESVLSLFDRLPSDTPLSISELADQLCKIRRDLDLEVNNAAITRSINVKVLFTPGRLIFGIPKILTKCVPELRDIQILYLIDELENLSENQQKFLNTLIRHRQGPSSFRLGARLYGIKTPNTLSDDEPNKEGSEYEVLYLDSRLRDIEVGYAEFARRLCSRRLRSNDFFRTLDIDARGFDKTLEGFFDLPESTRFHQSETLELVGSASGVERPYFKKLAQQLETARRVGAVMGVVSSADSERIIRVLEVPEFPLLEKINIFILYQEWSSGADIKSAAKKISDECKAYQRDISSKQATRYRQIISHYANDMLAQLYRDCGRRPQYAGFKTFVEMSAGVPRDLLIILKHVFTRSSFNGEAPFREGKISIKSQQEAIHDSASWFFEDALLPGSDGPIVRDGIGRLAELFREIRFSDKPVECSLVAFSVNEAEIGEATRRLLRLAENWSYLICIEAGQRDRNSMRVDAKFQLNPMIAPRWDLPAARRGTIPIRANLVDAMFTPERTKLFPDLLKERVAGMYAPYFGKRPKDSMSLQFDD